MTTAEIMAIMLSINAIIGVCFLILHFKIDNIKDDVKEIKRKMEGKE